MNLTNATVVGFFSLPSPSLAEVSPEAYNNAMREAPKGAGACQHCGTGIMHHVVIRLEDNSTAFIGRDCAERVGSERVCRCVRERLTAEQLAAREAKAEARREVWQAEREREESALRERLAIRFESVRDIVESLEALGTEFHSSLASQLRVGSLSDRQAQYAVKGILGRYSKRVAEQWDALYERCTTE